MKRITFFAALFFTAFVLCAVPRLTGYFTDLSGELGDLKPAIEKICASLESANGCELAVLVVRNMGGLTIEDFAEQVFQVSGIGKKGLDNGVLFILSIEDRRARIETGYGVEGIMPDSTANEFLTEYGVPHFKNNRWREGVLAVTARTAAHLTANYGAAGSTAPTSVAVPRARPAAESGTNDESTAFILLIPLLSAFIIFNGILAGRHRFMRKYHLIPEIGVVSAVLVLAAVLFSVAGENLIFLIIVGGVGVLVICIQYSMSARHVCPQCRKYMEIKSKVIVPPTYTSTGLRLISHYCPSCRYSNFRNAVIPQLTRTYSSRGGFRSGGGCSFGGGSSGGGGASVSF